MFVLRHAERADDALTADGRARGEELAHMIVKSGVSAVYATEWQRTQQTVQRLADLRSLEVQIYQEPEQLAQEILNNHQGEVILVAGHQPTVPEIIDLLGGDSDRCDIGAEYDNLCAITIPADGPADTINLQHGQPSP